VTAATWPELECAAPAAQHSSSTLRVGRRHRDWRPAVLLFLELSVFSGPQTLEVGDHVTDLLIAQLVRLKGRHGQLGCLVELIAQPTADDFRELRVGVPPGVARVIVGRCWQVASRIGPLPVRRTLCLGAVATGAVLPEHRAATRDLARIKS